MSDHEDYAHIHDPQSQRARRELWVILAIVVVVIVGGIVWRSLAHVPAKPQQNWKQRNTVTNTMDVEPAAAAGIHSGTSAPQPTGP